MDRKDLEPLAADGSSGTLAPGISRRSFFVAAGAAGVCGAATALGPTAAKAQSTDWQQPGNNNHVLALQEQSAYPDGPVTVDFYGHCAIKLTSPGGATVLFDPWRDDPSGAWGLWFKNEFPETLVDITMSTHTHFDHDAIHRPQSTMVLDRMVGSFAFADLKITGFADKHACVAPGWYPWTDALKEFGVDACPPNNPGHMDMVTYLVETGGIRTLIWGDNRHNPPDAFWEAVGPVDILTLPVDGSQHILSYAQGDAIVERLKPKIVIPTHYLGETTTYTLSTLQPADEWVKSQKSYKMLDGPALTLAAAEVSGMDREFLYFGDHAAQT
ncbi:MBL fold metallo-hydrolase [Kaustia mangrovi]|uniref:MBL fold metallo-hydrolase n=1 Tax=Kaustia mangrovi TaxID=2593653 RepID=A0A7S8C4A4_9HYPH|nr:MBL fold metallo-hydrolase [Kaustia mangrovi]QPC43083.1 MBL fold metallo-hydrolase [Kaustia mangrovi]